MSQSRLLTPAEASSLIQVATNTLAKWRVTGSGPCFLKVGSRVFYEQADLETWLQSRRRTSTSESTYPRTSATEPGR